MKKILLGAAIILLFGADAALALDMEFITYNGFTPVKIAFEKIALIFSDQNYKALFITACGIGILISVFSTSLVISRGSRFSPVAWAIPIMVGVVLYSAFIVPKGNVIILDPATNQAFVQSGVPNGIVLVAGILNRIERGVVDMIFTAATPGYSYKFYAGGLGFNVILKATGSPLTLPDQYMETSLRKYIKDCVFFELLLPDTRISVNQMKSKSTNFLDEFSKAQNPAIYTVFYDEDNRVGKTMTCPESWTRINAYMTDPANFTDMVNATCAEAGFDSHWAPEREKCKETIRTYIEVTSDLTGISETHFMRQSYLAYIFSDMLVKNDPEILVRARANRNTMSNGLATGVIANEWLPVIKAVITAIVIGMIPFLVLFIPTPVVDKALGVLVGFFVWLTAWGICDALVHSIAMDLCVNLMERIRLHNLGLLSMVYYPRDAEKALGVFGLMRTFGIMLATVVTGMLVRFGGHALSTMSSSLMGSSVQRQGAEGGDLLTPEGHASAINKTTEAVPTTAWYNKLGPEPIFRQKMYEKSVGTASANNIIDGQGGLDQAVDMSAWSARQSSLEETSRYGQRGDSHSTAIGTQRGHQEIARSEAVQNVSDRYFSGDTKQLFNRTEGFDTASKAGQASPHSIESAYDTSRTSEQERTGKMNALVSASSLSGGVENFARAVSSKDYTKAGSVISEYAKAKGVSHQEAATQIGGILGDKELVGVQGFENARDTVGRDQIAFAETNKFLNEAAKFEQAYQFANTLGYANSKEDFAGMYQAHQASNAQASWTLMEQGAVDRLNAQMAEQGLGTRFQVGDRVSMARTQDGRITLAKADAGASREELDLTSSKTGYRGEHGTFVREGNLHEHYDLYASKTGSNVEHFNQNVMHGHMQVQNPETGQTEDVYGTFNFHPETGQMVSSRFSGLHQGEVMTTFKGSDGRSATGVLKTSMDNKGNLIYKFDAVSDKTVVKGNPGEEFVAHQSINPSGKYVVLEKAQGGQDVGYYHQYQFHSDTKATFSVGAAIIDHRQNQDLTKLEEWQKAVLYTAEAGGKALNTAKMGKILFRKNK
jgi:hypothetical protein